MSWVTRLAVFDMEHVFSQTAIYFLKDQASRKEILELCFHSSDLKVCKLQSYSLKNVAWYEIKGEHVSAVVAAAYSASVCLHICCLSQKVALNIKQRNRKKAES